MSGFPNNVLSYIRGYIAISTHATSVPLVSDKVNCIFDACIDDSSGDSQCLSVATLPDHPYDASIRRIQVQHTRPRAHHQATLHQDVLISEVLTVSQALSCTLRE